MTTQSDSGAEKMVLLEKMYKAFDRIQYVFLHLSAGLILAVAVAVSFDVLVRFFFSVGLFPVIELTEFGLVWMTFLGAPWLLKMNGHINIDLVTSRLRSKPKHVVSLIAHIISVLLFIGVTFYSAKLTYLDYQVNFKLAGVLRATKWPIEIIIPIGFLFLLLQSIRNLIQQLMNGSGNTRFSKQLK